MTARQAAIAGRPPDSVHIRDTDLGTEREGGSTAKAAGGSTAGLKSETANTRVSGQASLGLARRSDPDRMQSMAKTLTADDILPLVASLTPLERVRLLRLMALPHGADAPVYRSVPPSRDEFSADEEPLAWDAEGWEDVV